MSGHPGTATWSCTDCRPGPVAPSIVEAVNGVTTCGHAVESPHSCRTVRRAMGRFSGSSVGRIAKLATCQHADGNSPVTRSGTGSPGQMTGGHESHAAVPKKGVVRNGSTSCPQRETSNVTCCTELSTTTNDSVTSRRVTSTCTVYCPAASRPSGTRRTWVSHGSVPHAAGDIWLISSRSRPFASRENATMS